MCVVGRRQGQKRLRWKLLELKLLLAQVGIISILSKAHVLSFRKLFYIFVTGGWRKRPFTCEFMNTSCHRVARHLQLGRAGLCLTRRFLQLRTFRLELRTRTSLVGRIPWPVFVSEKSFLASDFWNDPSLHPSQLPNFLFQTLVEIIWSPEISLFCRSCLFN